MQRSCSGEGPQLRYIILLCNLDIFVCIDYTLGGLYYLMVFRFCFFCLWLVEGTLKKSSVFECFFLYSRGVNLQCVGPPPRDSTVPTNGWCTAGGINMVGPPTAGSTNINCVSSRGKGQVDEARVSSLSWCVELPQCGGPRPPGRGIPPGQGIPPGWGLYPGVLCPGGYTLGSYALGDIHWGDYTLGAIPWGAIDI